MAEQRTLNPRVAGSTPASPAQKKNNGGILVEPNASAIKANARLEAQSNAYLAGQPARESHETLKEIKVLLAEVLEMLKKNNA